MKKTRIASSEAFIVVEYDWQYNDEAWYMPEGEPYYAVEVFDNKEDAEKELTKANLGLMRGTYGYVDTFSNWYYELPDEIEEIEKWLKKHIPNEPWESLEPNDINKANLPDDVVMELFNLLNMCWYQVLRVDRNAS